MLTEEAFDETLKCLTGKAVSTLNFGENNNFTFDFPVCGLGPAGEVLQTNLKSTGSPEVGFLSSEDAAGLDNCSLRNKRNVVSASAQFNCQQHPQWYASRT